MPDILVLNLFDISSDSIVINAGDTEEKINLNVGLVYRITPKTI